MIFILIQLISINLVLTVDSNLPGHPTTDASIPTSDIVFPVVPETESLNCQDDSLSDMRDPPETESSDQKTHDNVDPTNLNNQFCVCFVHNLNSLIQFYSKLNMSAPLFQATNYTSEMPEAELEKYEQAISNFFAVFRAQDPDFKKPNMFEAEAFVNDPSATFYAGTKP